jgi:hypothetical protein
MTTLFRLSVCTLFAPWLLVAQNDSTCGDLLAAIQKKPTSLEFQSCRQRADLQGKPDEADYRVPGSHAAEVENFLAKEAGLKRLQRTCCIWESVKNPFEDRSGQRLEITMATEETTIDKKKQWAKIPYFYVKVYRYRELP